MSRAFWDKGGKDKKGGSSPAPSSDSPPQRAHVKLPDPKPSSRTESSSTSWRNEREDRRVSEANVSTGKIAEINDILDAEISKITDWKKKEEAKYLLDEIIAEEAIAEIVKTYDGDNDASLNERELSQFLGHDLGFLKAVADTEAKKILGGRQSVDIPTCINILKDRYGLRVDKCLMYPRIVSELDPVGSARGQPQDFDLIAFPGGADADAKAAPEWKNKILAAIEEAEFETACWKKTCSVLRDRLAHQTHQTTRAWLRCCHQMEVVRNLTAAIRKIDNQAKIISKIEQQTADEVGFGVSLEVADQIRQAKEDERKKWEEVVEKAKDDVQRMQEATATELMAAEKEKHKAELEDIKEKFSQENREREAQINETTVTVDEYEDVQEMLEKLNKKYNETFDQYEDQWKHSRKLEEEVERLEREKRRLQSELDLQKRPTRKENVGGLVRESFNLGAGKRVTRTTRTTSSVTAMSPTGGGLPPPAIGGDVPPVQKMPSRSAALMAPKKP